MKDINVLDIVGIAKKAGKEILNIYEKDYGIEYKDDNSPLTEADNASNKVINAELTKLYPGIPILSEENKEAPYEERKRWEYFWLVDPLDGTKEFIKKNGEFTINIALVHRDRPVLGVVYVPVKDVVYYAKEGLGSFRQEKDKKEEKLKPKKVKRDKLIVVASRSHFSQETMDYIESFGKKYELVSAGSSLKVCLVAEGKADIYPRLGKTMEWDTAAANVIAKLAGKRVYDYDTKKELRYNKENLLNPWFVVE